MTKVIAHELLKKEVTSKWYEKFLNWLLKRPNEGIFTVKLTLQNNVGYWPNNLVMLNTSIKAVVVKSELNIVTVKTIKPSREFKSARGVKLLLRKWAGNEN